MLIKKTFKTENNLYNFVFENDIKDFLRIGLKIIYKKGVV